MKFNAQIKILQDYCKANRVIESVSLHVEVTIMAESIGYVFTFNGYEQAYILAGLCDGYTSAGDLRRGAKDLPPFNFKHEVTASANEDVRALNYHYNFLSKEVSESSIDKRKCNKFNDHKATVLDRIQEIVQGKLGFTYYGKPLIAPLDIEKMESLVVNYIQELRAWKAAKDKQLREEIADGATKQTLLKEDCIKTLGELTCLPTEPLKSLSADILYPQVEALLIAKYIKEEEIDENAKCYDDNGRYNEKVRVWYNSAGRVFEVNVEHEYY